MWVDPDDVFYKTSMVVGAISSLLSMQGQLQNETPNAYTATTKGINVSAEAGFYLNGNNISINETFTLYQGDSDALTYKLAPNGTTNAAPTEAQDNVLFITTWRQKPQTNTSTQEPSSADLLIVALINQSLYSSQQLTKHLTQTTTPSQQKLTREQARDTSKVLSVLSTIRKAHPQDAQYIVGMFGIHGKYEEIKKNPNELRTLNQRLKQILSPYRNNSLVIEQSLPKL